MTDQKTMELFIVLRESSGTFTLYVEEPVAQQAEANFLDGYMLNVKTIDGTTYHFASNSISVLAIGEAKKKIAEEQACPSGCLSH